MTDNTQMKPLKEYETEIKAQLMERGIDPVEGENPEFKKRVRYLTADKGLTLEQAVENYIEQEGRENFAKYNLVKATCRELGITQKELAKKLGIKEVTINKWSSNSDVPIQGDKAIILLLNYTSLKKDMHVVEMFKNFIKDS